MTIQMNTPKEVTSFKIDAQSTIGKATIGVADLEMMTDFYQRLIGLTIIERSSSSVVLGIDGTSLLQLEQQSGGKAYPNAAGLYHFALLVPSRAALGAWLTHLRSNNYPLTGASDHLVSEALYLDDPEGNGIEVYRDRPRDKWPYEGSFVKMDTLRLDLAALLADAEEKPFYGLPSGTTMGHIHLQVDDVEKNARFYQEALGFDLMMLWPEAGFLSAGGYHHHVGMNIWHSRGAAQPPTGSLGLLRYEIRLPNAEARSRLLARLAPLDVEVTKSNGEPLVIDPSGNQAILRAG